MRRRHNRRNVVVSDSSEHDLSETLKPCCGCDAARLNVRYGSMLEGVVGDVGAAFIPGVGLRLELCTGVVLY